MCEIYLNVLCVLNKSDAKVMLQIKVSYLVSSMLLREIKLCGGHASYVRTHTYMYTCCTIVYGICAILYIK